MLLPLLLQQLLLLLLRCCCRCRCCCCFRGLVLLCSLCVLLSSGYCCFPIAVARREVLYLHLSSDGIRVDFFLRMQTGR